MKIEIEKRNDIPPEIEHYVIKRAKKIEKYISKGGSLRCVISHQKGNFIVEITLKDLINTFISHASSNDLKLSINEGLEKIEHQFKRFKKKIIDHKKTIFKEFGEEKTSPIIKIRKIEPLLLFIDEAIEQFKEEKGPFFVFINKETNKHSIILKTKKEHYELIEC